MSSLGVSLNHRQLRVAGLGAACLSIFSRANRGRFISPARKDAAQPYIVFAQSILGAASAQVLGMGAARRMAPLHRASFLRQDQNFSF